MSIDLDYPDETVIVWNEPLSQIPDGWVICDGNNGTPNLLDKFVRGASSGQSSLNTGGANDLNLSSSNLSSHGHGISSSSSSVSDHRHNFEEVARIDLDANAPEDADLKREGPSNEFTTTGYSHSHGASTGSGGGGSSIDNRPVGIEQAFIMQA